MRYEHSVEVEATAEAVLAVWTDVERWPDWTASITSVRRLDSGPLGVGSRARVKQPKLPPAVWTVTGLEPGRSFIWVSNSVGVRTEAEHRVTPTATGVTATLVLDQKGPLATVAGWIAGRLARRYLEMEAAGLKRRAEQGTP